MRYERVTLKIERALTAQSASPSNLFTTSRAAQCTMSKVFKLFSETISELSERKSIPPWNASLSWVFKLFSKCFQKLFRNYLRGKTSHLGEPCWVEFCESGEPAPGSRLGVFFGLELIFWLNIMITENITFTVADFCYFLNIVITGTITGADFCFSKHNDYRNYYRCWFLFF